MSMWFLLPLFGLLTTVVGAGLICATSSLAEEEASLLRDKNEEEKQGGHGWPVAATGVLATWLLSIPFLGVTWELLLRALPGLLLGIWVVVHSYGIIRMPDKIMLFPVALVWLWLAALPFLHSLAWWALVLQVPGALAAAHGFRQAGKEIVQEPDEETWRQPARARQNRQDAQYWLVGAMVSTFLSGLAAFPSHWPAALFGVPLLGAVTGMSGADSPVRTVVEVLARVAGLAFLSGLPVLCATGCWWLFLLLEVFPLALAEVVIQSMTQDNRSRDSAGTTALIFCFCLVLFGLPVWALSVAGGWAAWTCSHWPTVCQTWPWPLLLLPLALASIYVATELIPLPGRPSLTSLDLGARLLLLVMVGATPVVLYINVESCFSWVVMPDLNPEVYAESISNHGARGVKWLSMPEPLWPNATEMEHSGASRADFWLSFMALKYFGALLVSVLLLRIGWPSQGGYRSLSLEPDVEGAEAQESQEVSMSSMSDRSRDLLMVVLVPCWLAVCTKLTLSAARGGQLNADSGLAWEGYDLLFSLGLTFFLLQSLVLRAMSLACYSPDDVAVASISLFPFLGDAFDTLKDSMLASVAIYSNAEWVRWLGCLAMVYLWALHLLALLPVKSQRLELSRSYLALFFLNPKQQGVVASGLGQKILRMLYKQTHPGRQLAIAAEDVPQAILASAISFEEGLKPFTLTVNLLIPAVRLLGAWRFHDSIAWEVRGWLLQEALKAAAAGRVSLCDEYAKALCRLQVCAKQDLWQELGQEQQAAARRYVQKEAKLQKVRGPLHEWVRLQLETEGEGSEMDTLHLNFTASPLMKLAHGFPSLAARCRNRSKVFLSLWGASFAQGGRELCSLGELKRCRELKVSLEQCVLDAQGHEALCQGLGRLEQLEQLDLGLLQNKIGPKVCKALGQSLGELTKLRQLALELANNEIGDEGCGALGLGLGQLTCLDVLVLKLSGTGIGGTGIGGRTGESCEGCEGCVQLGEGLGMLRNLSTLRLNVNYNNIDGRGMSALVRNLNRLRNLADLDMSLRGLAIGSEGFEALSRSMETLTLSKLRLDTTNSDLGPEECRALGQGLQGLARHLRELDLQVAVCVGVTKAEASEAPEALRLHAEGCRALGSGLGQLSELTALNLGMSFKQDGESRHHSFALGQIESECFKAASHGVQNLRNLRKLILDLHDCDFGAEACGALSHTLVQLHHLSELELYLKVTLKPVLDWTSSSVAVKLDADCCSALGSGLCQLNLTVLKLAVHFDALTPDVPEPGELSDEQRDKLQQELFNKLSSESLAAVGNLALLRSMDRLSPELSSLTLQVAGPDTEVLKALCQMLGQLRELRDLFLGLWQHVADPEGWQALSRTLGDLANLQKLSAAFVGGGRQGIQCKGDEICEALCLHLAQWRLEVLELDLSSCDIGDDGCKTLAALTQLPNLKELSLNLTGNHRISAEGGGAQVLRSSLDQLSFQAKLQLPKTRLTFGSHRGPSSP